MFDINVIYSTHKQITYQVQNPKLKIQPYNCTISVTVNWLGHITYGGSDDQKG